MQRLRPLIASAVALFACGAFVFAPPPGRADDVPDSATLRARIASAQGPIPTNVRETIVGSGILGELRETIYRHGNDVRTTVDRGAIHTETGTFKGERWHQDANGVTVLDAADPGEVRRDVITTTVKRVTTPVDAYVISALNVRDQGTREYVDAATSLPIRRERLGPSGTETRTYDRYASFARRTLPARWTDRTPKGQTMTYERTAYDADAVSEADVAIPPIRRELVSFPAGSVREELPVHFVRGHVYVRVRIGNRTGDFALDSGAARMYIEAATARELGVTLVNTSTASGTEIHAGSSAVVPTLRIGALEMKDTVVDILARPLVKLPGLKVVGVLGFDFLATLGIAIDYEHEGVVASRAGSYSPPEGRYVITLPVRLATQVAMTSASFDGAVADHLVIDTGFDSSFVLYDTFLRRYPEFHEINEQPLQRFSTAYGVFAAHPYSFDAIDVGRIRFRGVAGYGTTNPGVYPGIVDGVIGYNFLRLFTVHFDYPSGQVYLVPNALGQKAIGLTR